MSKSSAASNQSQQLHDVSGGPDTSITLVNNYGAIHPGISQLSTGIDGKQVSTPIYVASAQVVTGNTVLPPIETILVWFEQNVQTSTMVSTSRSKAIEIDLTFANSANRLYAAGEWKTV